MNRFYLLTLLFFFLAPPGFTQNSGDYRIQKFNTENGLPSNGIKGLQWEEQTGFLWIATEAGIVRYNGMEFKVYNKDDNLHITSERIIFMVKTIGKNLFRR
jgi:ligand-binding sensor domain-containing protein